MAKYLTDEVDNVSSLRKRVRTETSEDEVNKILFALTLPSEADVIRYTGNTSGNPTSAKTLMQDVKLNWQTVTIDGNIPAAEQMVFLFRNPLRSFIFYDANPSGQTFDYILHNTIDGSTSFANPDGVTGGYYKPNFGVGTPNASLYQPHGDYIFPGFAQERFGYWCDNDGKGNTTALGVVFDADPGAGGADIMWYLWDGAQWSMSMARSTTAGVVNYFNAGPPPGGCYMTIDIKLNTNAANAFKIHLKSAIGAGGIWCHRSIPNISELLPIINGVRVNAVSLLWTNFSSELQASGKLVSVGVAPCLPWSNIAISQSNLTKLQGYESRPAKTGYYGFLKPDGPGDFMMFNDIRTMAWRGSVITFATFPIQERYSYIAASLSVANVDARDTSIQVTHAIEYLTNSKIQEVQDPPYSAASWTAAIQALQNIDQHHENKFHFGQILRGIGKVGKFIFKGAQIVTKSIPLPMFQGVGKALDMAEGLGANQLFDAMAHYGRRRARPSTN